MKREKKRWLVLVMSAVLVLGTCFAAQAAETKIDKVKLTFSGTEPKSGEAVGDIDVRTDSNEFSVDYAEYTNSLENWTVGVEPEVKIELVAKDGYKFGYTSKSHFNLSGMNAEFERAKIYDNGSYMEVTATLKRIGGKLTGSENLEWGGKTAYWDAVEGSKQYEVNLRRNEKTVTTVETTSTSYNFAGYMDREGNYSFRVRAISSYNNRVGEWSDYSDEIYISESEAGSGGQWKNDQYGWWYAYNGGGYPANCWKQIGGAWYYFAYNGYMLTGWQQINGSWYYLAPSGAMTIGWQNVGGVWYYMDGNGVMLTGWQQIGGRMYYLGTNGAMWANTATPDGHYVDGSGAMVY